MEGQYYLSEKQKRKNIITFLLLKNKSNKTNLIKILHGTNFLGKGENKPYWLYYQNNRKAVFLLMFIHTLPPYLAVMRKSLCDFCIY